MDCGNPESSVNETAREFIAEPSLGKLGGATGEKRGEHKQGTSWHRSSQPGMKGRTSDAHLSQPPCASQSHSLRCICLDVEFFSLDENLHTRPFKCILPWGIRQEMTPRHCRRSSGSRGRDPLRSKSTSS